jgi:hypothetical protein
VTYECQVCDYKLGDNEKLTGENGYEQWNVEHIGLKEGELQVLVCPKCSHLGLDQIFTGYQKKIRQGKNPDYH